ncbi:hypothetical protein [Burkholderia vietnamiensis]|uniref:hypothetical protein n=1 Tax=Burkholderia vietnamiensis TaxID=60552 RepID=UPI001BA3C528|nr:hypothetical protein [Burkholderia vietnamiensis]MBR7998305.1 hypothetical protein [Burkholderia vietnamiensis]
MTTTDNSRADALTDKLTWLVDRWTESMNEEQAKRQVDSVGVAAGIRGCINTLRIVLAASPVEQPAAAPIVRVNRHAVMRLKSICRKLGIESAVPEEVFVDPDGLFAIFGQIRNAIDRLTRPATLPSGVLHALRAAKQFIANGVELGYIRMPDSDCPDPAHEVPNLIDAAISSLSTAPSPADERAALLSDDEYCDLQAAVQALELIASGLTYAKDHDLDGTMQKATIRDAMRHAKNALRRLNPVYHKLADTWQEARAASANETGAEVEKRGPCICQEDLGHPDGTCVWKNGRAPCAAPQPAQADARVGLTEQAITDAVKKWFPDRAYQAPFFARALLQGANQ